jgi:GxxExxY protein
MILPHAKTQRRKERIRIVMRENQIAKDVVDAAFRVHTKLGPGLLESVYEVVLAYELEKKGLSVIRQKSVSVKYDDMVFDIGFRADIIVEDLVILELKSVEATAPVHKKQLLTYLRLADKKLGLLINFGAPLIKHGISRIVNGLKD